MQGPTQEFLLFSLTYSQMPFNLPFSTILSIKPYVGNIKDYLVFINLFLITDHHYSVYQLSYTYLDVSFIRNSLRIFHNPIGMPYIHKIIFYCCKTGCVACNMATFKAYARCEISTTESTIS